MRCDQWQSFGMAKSVLHRHTLEYTECCSRTHFNFINLGQLIILFASYTIPYFPSVLYHWRRPRCSDRHSSALPTSLSLHTCTGKPPFMSVTEGQDLADVIPIEAIISFRIGLKKQPHEATMLCIAKGCRFYSFYNITSLDNMTYTMQKLINSLITQPI